MKPWMQGLYLMAHSIGRRRSRPAAIILAVGWGTLAMMLLLGFGEGLKQQMSRGKLGLGDKPVIVWAGTTTRPWQGMRAGREIRLSEEDAAALKREIPEIDEVAGERRLWSVDLRWGSKSVSSQLTGVMPCYERLRSHHPRPGGRFINDVDQVHSRRVLFIGPALKDRLFGPAEAIGQTVLVRGVPFTVVGVMVDKQQNGMYGGPDIEKASIPLSAFESVFGKTPYSNLLYSLKPGADAAAAEKSVRDLFARRYRFDPADENTLSFWDNVRNDEAERKIFNGLQAFLGIVGGMTLMVAGVGLANMLFVMVYRRTREIGLMMAIGGRRIMVGTQIIGESLLLAAIGGYLGIGFSWAIVEGLHRIPVRHEGLQFLGKPTLSIPLGIVTLVLLIAIGCLAGALPAGRATRLNPVEALRHEL